MPSRASHHEQGILKDSEKVEGSAVGTRRTGKDRPLQSDHLRESPMMAKMWDDLKKKVDIGHYGRLVFTMVGRHFFDEDDLLALLANNIDPEDAQALLINVNSRNYNPPRRERILHWQERQDYKMIPDDHLHNLQWGNLYSELQLPKEIYGQVNEFYKEAAKDLEDHGPVTKAKKKS